MPNICIDSPIAESNRGHLKQSTSICYLCGDRAGKERRNGGGKSIEEVTSSNGYNKTLGSFRAFRGRRCVWPWRRSCTASSGS